MTTLAQNESSPRETDDIRDIKPLMETGILLWWSLIIGIFLLASLFWLMHNKIFKKKITRPPVVVPHEKALFALRELRARGPQTLAEIRKYYFEISTILRTYVEEILTMNATDLTTEEILRHLEHQANLPTAAQTDLKEFLRHTDPVKFAKATASPHDVEQVYRYALSFVELTTPTTMVEQP